MKTEKEKSISQIWKEYFQNKDDESRNLLVVHYLPIVKYTAIGLRSLFPRSVEVDDLYNSGAIGLMKAVEKFNPKKKVRFETYCTWRIKGEILDDLRRRDWIPRLVRQRAQQLQKATLKLRALLGRRPTEEELAKEFRMNEKEFSRFRRDAQALHLFSLSTSLAEGDRDRDFQEMDVLADRKSQDPYVAALKKDLKEFALKGFQREERLVVLLYYYDRMTMQEVGKTLGISESRVSQVHTSIIDRLKSRYEDHAQLKYLLKEGA